MKRTFTQKLFVSFILIFLLFSTGIVLFEHNRAKLHRIEALEERLDGYTEIIHQYINNDKENLDPQLNNLLPILPANLRVTIINNNGYTLFDNQLEERNQNLSTRPEIIEAKENRKGSSLRKSTSTQTEYLYYAKYSNNKYIRVALPYDSIKNLLKPDNSFIYYILFLLFIGILFIAYTARYFGKTISRLRDFVHILKSKEDIEFSSFPDDEIGYIRQQIAESYNRINDNKQKLALEREKFLMHIQSSNEGVCFFTPEREISFYNGLFLRHLNIISDRLITDANRALRDNIFSEIYEFVLKNNNENAYFETQINKNGKNFIAKVNVFYDQSFEIVLTDVTQEEKNKLLKREMTGNIAHELRTPVSGIRGYLETILENNLERNKEHEFVNKAYEQTMTLSDLIRDMSLLSRINEAPSIFQFQYFKLKDLINRVKDDLKKKLEEKDIIIHSTINENLLLYGNENLIYSIFRNLTDNVINYAGESITITINLYNQDERWAYFSFSDNGMGIQDKKHLNRIFERFYRVTEGRSRETGGSGLGLSIVKNAVEFHGGNISVKNRKEGGLEFLFNLPL